MEKIDDKVEDQAEETDCINAVVGFIIKYSKFNKMKPIFWVRHEWHCWPNHQVILKENDDVFVFIIYKQKK